MQNTNAIKMSSAQFHNVDSSFLLELAAAKRWTQAARKSVANIHGSLVAHIEENSNVKQCPQDGCLCMTTKFLCAEHTVVEL